METSATIFASNLHFVWLKTFVEDGMMQGMFSVGKKCNSIRWLKMNFQTSC
jgi:hypothetical protein